MSDAMHSASCLCGGVRLEVTGDMSHAGSCHCGQCRKQTGHFFAAVEVPRSAMKITGEEHIRWYKSSNWAQRGFCGTCGSTLFFDMPGTDTINIALGLFETPTDTRLRHHTHTAFKGDYYEIGDGLPCYPGMPGN